MCGGGSFIGEGGEGSGGLKGGSRAWGNWAGERRIGGKDHRFFALDGKGNEEVSREARLVRYRFSPPRAGAGDAREQWEWEGSMGNGV